MICTTDCIRIMRPPPKCWGSKRLHFNPSRKLKFIWPKVQDYYMPLPNKSSSLEEVHCKFQRYIRTNVLSN